jgi:hypothetical protein
MLKAEAIMAVIGPQKPYIAHEWSAKTIEIDCLDTTRTEKVSDYERDFAGQSFKEEQRAYEALNTMAGRIGRAAQAARDLIAQAAEDGRDVKAEIAGAFNAWLARHYPLEIDHIRRNRDLMSPMIAGPSGFPQARMEKLNRWHWNRGDRLDAAIGGICKRMKRIAFPHGAPGEAIRSADPDALDKIAAEIQAKKAAQERMKEENNMVRTAERVTKAAKTDEGDQAVIDELAKTMGRAQAHALGTRDFAGRRGYPSYALTNNRAEIRRLEARLAGLRRVREVGNVERTEQTAAGEIEILHNAEAHRIQIIFPGKPDADVRAILKRNGFRWAPSQGAWQRHLNTNGTLAAQRVLAQIQAAGNAG